MRNKYHAKKVNVDGITFASKKEAKRYAELLILQKAKKISGLELQHKFELLPSQKDDSGKVIERPVTYIADFVYFQDCQLVVEDAKGYRTPEYIIKRKLMYNRYGIQIREV